VPAWRSKSKSIKFKKNEPGAVAVVSDTFCNLRRNLAFLGLAVAFSIVYNITCTPLSAASLPAGNPERCTDVSLSLRRIRREVRGAFPNWPGYSLKIIHLGKFYPPAPGGIETHLQTLAVSQARLGAEVRVLCVNHADRHDRDVTFSRFTPTPTRTDEDQGVPIERIGRHASIARLDICPALPGRLRRLMHESADVIHLHTPNPTMMIALAASSCRKPLVVTHHSDVVRQKILRHALTPFERIVYGRASKILTDSPPYLDGSVTLSRYRDKVTDLPLGIDLEPLLNPSVEVLAEADHWKREFDGPLWLMVGRLIYYKGIDVALHALTNVPGRLLIIGTGPLQPSMRLLAERLGVADRVTWNGHASPNVLQGAYRAATALWFPSVARSEGFGLVQVEAMASGCPVINTAISHSGVSWVSRHEETGLTVPVKDPSAFGRAAVRLIDEPELRQRLSVRARQRAIDMFSQETMARRSIEIYRSITRSL